MATVAETIQSPSIPSAQSGEDGVPPRVRVAIVGAGISGLALAVALKRAGVSFALIEQSPRVGGVIGSVDVQGFIFERGPNTILARTPAIDELIQSVGLSGEVLRTPLRGQVRHIWHGGRLHEVPAGPGALLRSKLFSFKAKLSLLREPLVRPVREDESIEDLIRRRLGNEIYERAFVPMIQGIWAGDPSAMSAEASFPLLKSLERENGSLIRGMIAMMKAAAKARRASPTSATPSMISFRRGLESLPQAMSQHVSESLQLGTSVEKIQKFAAGFSIQLKHHAGYRELQADSVVLCSEAWSAAQMVDPIAPEAAAALRRVHYAPLVAVGLGVESSLLRLPPGFGFLAARNQGLRILGCIFNSNFLAGRTPEGCSALTVMIGGDLDPKAVKLDDDALLDLIRRDLKTALRWNGCLRAIHIERWARAIPRYGLDHSTLAATLQKAELDSPGLRFFGNACGGVSLGDRIEKASALAKEIASTTSMENPTTA